MGIVCSVPIIIKSKENHIKINVTAIPNKKKVEVAINDNVLEIEADGKFIIKQIKGLKC